MFNDIYNFVWGLNKKTVFLILDINFFLTLLLLQNVHVGTFTWLHSRFKI
ncbi:unnamed protein product [Acanthoscelides obtectus]|uniref:Uncharacterized protein n=1 Tax=Acanthoscelides obtectus TaxID=200917 RepID=A0A9P0P9K2_ACAOB|nr:unnamed protein product [Acanthoscelides obtectus]CAK1660876.1 hypothetical protein AOBTE_LOCUS22305 [Acanthoscelides obtectus]